MSDTKQKNYEWRLVWANCIDTKYLHLVTKHCKTYHLFRDAKAHLINHAEYTNLIDQGQIAPATKFWSIRPNELGLIALSAYDSYRTTWDAIGTCKTDFVAGYKAHRDALADLHTLIDKTLPAKQSQALKRSVITLHQAIEALLAD